MKRVRNWSGLANLSDHTLSLGGFNGKVVKAPGKTKNC